MIQAIKQTFWRILIIFMGLVFFASIIVPSDSPSLLSAETKSGKSPWTIALVNAGWPGAGNLINVVMITAQLSSINTCIYVCSRSLASLAVGGKAPRFFGKTTSNGTPVNAIIFSNFLGLLALLNYTAGPGKIFTYLVDIGGAATFVAWAFIGVTHIRMRKAWAVQGYSVKELPYRALWYPYGAWFVVIINVFLVIISGYTTVIGTFDAVDFVFNYIVLVIFAALFIFWKLYKKTKWVKLEEIDLVSGRRDDLCALEAEDVEQEGAKISVLKKAKRFMFG